MEYFSLGKLAAVFQKFCFGRLTTAIVRFAVVGAVVVMFAVIVARAARMRQVFGVALEKVHVVVVQGTASFGRRE